MTTSTIDIADLISLLDQETRAALSARLEKVAHAHETPADPRQLLFEFIDSSLKELEDEQEFSHEKEALIAEAFLSAINNTSKE